MDVALRAVSWIWGFYFMRGSAACASAAFRGAFLRVAVPARRATSRRISSAATSTATTISAMPSASSSSAPSFVRPPRADAGWRRAGDRRRRDLQPDERRRRRLREVDAVSPPGARSVPHLRHCCSQRHGEPLAAGVAVAAGADARVRRGVHQARRPRAARRRRRRWPDSEARARRHINDHRYLLSAGAALFGRGRFQASRRAVHGRVVLAARAVEGAAGVRRDRRSRRRRSQSKAFPDGGFYVLRSDRAHVFVDCGEVGMHGSRRPRPQRHPQLRGLARRDEPRHRLRRLSLHRVARVAESLSQHRVSQRRAGRRRGAESVHLAR